jgi:hypothetical protein
MALRLPKKDMIGVSPTNLEKESPEQGDLAEVAA